LLRDRISADLRQAMTDRDMARARLLRTTLAAIENAEAVEGVSSVAGVVGYSDVSRRALDDRDVMGILVSEIGEWERSLAEYQRIGQTERAGELQRELEILRSYLSEE
jgi:uncharacterized protein YqeY